MSGLVLAQPWALRVAEEGVIVFFLLLNSAAALFLLLAIRELMGHWHIAEDAHLGRVLTSEALPPLSVLVAQDDAGAPSLAAIHALLDLEYPRHEVVLVVDGVPEPMVRDLELYPVPPAVMVTIPTAPVRGYRRSHAVPKLLVIDKEHVGRADALNAAMNAARYPYVVALGRTQLVSDALRRLARPFLLGQSVAAVAATVRVADARETPASVPRIPSRWLEGEQAIDVLRDRAYADLGWNRVGGDAAPDEAIVLCLRDHALAVGGYRPFAASADADLVMRVHRHLREQALPANVHFLPEPVAFAEAAPTVRELARRRDRTQRGHIQLLTTNGDLFLRRRAGATGLLTLPLLFLREVAAPVVEAIGYACVLIALAIGAPVGTYVALFLLAGPGYSVLLSLWTIVLERVMAAPHLPASDLARLGVWALVEPVGYRQLVMWWRLRASWRAVRNRHVAAGQQQELRTGRVTTARAVPPA